MNDEFIKNYKSILYKFIIRHSAVSALEKSDTIGTRMTQILADLHGFSFTYILEIQAKLKKIRANLLNPRHPCSHSISIFQSVRHSSLSADF
jgi:hypothetical protein